MSARERLLAALAASPEVRPGEAEQKVADALAERDAQIIAWLGKKAHEYEGRSGPRAESASDVLARMASKIARGAVRPPTTAGQAPAPDPSPSLTSCTCGAADVLVCSHCGNCDRCEDCGHCSGTGCTCKCEAAS